jgi:hypothetical protein
LPRFSPNPGFVAFCVHPSTSDGVVLELFTHGGIYIAVASRYKVPDFVARRRINLLFLLLPSQVTAMSTVPFVTSTFQATAATPSFCPLRQRYHEKGDDPKASAPPTIPSDPRPGRQQPLASVVPFSGVVSPLKVGANWEAKMQPCGYPVMIWWCAAREDSSGQTAVVPSVVRYYGL